MASSPSLVEHSFSPNDLLRGLPGALADGIVRFTDPQVSAIVEGQESTGLV